MAGPSNPNLTFQQAVTVYRQGRLDRLRSTAPLFDSERYHRHVEQA
jgi:hypothetical protein